MHQNIAQAEVQQHNPPIEAVVGPMRMDMLPSDEWSRARAAQFIGRVLSGDVYVEPTTEQAPNTSLLEAIKRAKDGDDEALASVRTNAHIAVVEAMLKTGHITEVRLSKTESGNWLQHGQAMLHVHANALVGKAANIHPGLRERTEREITNGQRIEDADRASLLENYWIFVPSLFPAEHEVPFDIATEKAGFFGDTVSASFQMTSVEDGEGVVQTAFVSGVAQSGSPRHDIATVRRMYALAGFDAEHMQPEDFLATPLLIPKEHTPNGVADVVELFDQLTENDTFFGQSAEKKKYSTMLATSKEREKGMNRVTDKVVARLLDSALTSKTTEDAVAALAELVRVHGSEHAARDTSIDPLVFGSVSAGHIEQFRIFEAMGDHIRAQQQLTKAKDTAIASSCGMTTKGKGALGENLDKELDDVKETEEDSGDCDFVSKECPQCGEKNVGTSVRKNKRQNTVTISGTCGCSVTKSA